MIKNVDEIKKQANVESILHTLGATNIKGNGNEFRANCPISDHRKSPQCFSIDQSTGQWFCHACGEGGDIIELVEKVNNVSFKEAVNFVAECSGTDVGTFKPAIKQAWSTQPKKSKTGRTPQQVLNDSSLEGNNTYLKEKRVDSCPGLYFGKDEKGNDAIVVPFRNVQNELQTVQFVHTKGKYFLGDYPSGEAFFTIGSFEDGDEIFLAEGLATADTIWMSFDEEKTVISFGSANNMVKVVDALKSKYSSLKIIICLDNSDAAFKQARLINPIYGCSFRVPSFEGLTSQNPDKGLADFNDLISKCGQDIKVVREQLMIEKTINDLPIQKNTLMAEGATRANDRPSSDLTSDIELEVLRYLSAKSFNDIVDDGLNPEEFNLALFNGSCIKEDKDLISINRQIAEIVIGFWEKDQSFAGTDIALRAGAHADVVHNILKNIENLPVLDANKIKERLNKLQNDSAIAKVQNLFNKFKSDGTITPAQFDLLSSEIERGKAQTHALHNDEYYLAEMLEKEKNDNKPYIPTEFADLNRLLKGGLRGGKLITLQGYAGAGKSTFMIQMRDYLAKQDVPVVFVAMEQSRNELREISKNRIKLEIREQKRANKENHENAELEFMSNKEYSSFCKNLFTIEGFEHIEMHSETLSFLTLSKIRGHVLNVIQNTGKKPILFIDPFQRLSTGYKNLDANEYDKINALVALIKCLAIKLDITIIMASDVTKGHEENIDGDGAGRGSYMIQHLSDVIITFKVSEKDPFEAMFGLMTPANDAKETKIGSKTIFLSRQQQLVAKVMNSPTGFLSKYKLSENSFNEKWVSTVVSKNRGYKVFSPLFIFQQGKKFKEVPIWQAILPSEDED